MSVALKAKGLTTGATLLIQNGATYRMVPRTQLHTCRQTGIGDETPLMATTSWVMTGAERSVASYICVYGVAALEDQVIGWFAP